MSDGFLYHTNCPKCGSRDNLGVYEDHSFCFGCGYTKSNYKARIVKKDISTKQLYLPDDIVTTIPHEADAWLRKYDLTQKELFDNKVVWSNKTKLLIFLYSENNILLGWQGRYFGTDPSKPKWWNQGDLKKINKIINPSKLNESLIIVEDIVSAIKVGRQYSCKTLFGSYLDYVTLYNLYIKYNINNIYIWLDKDKQLEAHKYSYKLNNLGINSSVIVTKLDPKLYSNSDIKVIYESSSRCSSSIS